jgi:two-component system OmpR family response regulator
LILTGQASVEDRVRGLNEGADDYLAKPFECTELVARLRALVRRAAGEPAPNVALGDLEVNLAARTVNKSNKTVHLTAKEFALLELLLLNRGRPVSRSRIYHHLYNDEDDTISNVLDVYVSSLRKKLGRWLVHTRRGEGYVVPEHVDMDSEN